MNAFPATSAQRRPRSAKVALNRRDMRAALVSRPPPKPAQC
jgi:hypothetical protein